MQARDLRDSGSSHLEEKSIKVKFPDQKHRPVLSKDDHMGEIKPTKPPTSPPTFRLNKPSQRSKGNENLLKRIHTKMNGTYKSTTTNTATGTSTIKTQTQIDTDCLQSNLSKKSLSGNNGCKFSDWYLQSSEVQPWKHSKPHFEYPQSVLGDDSAPEEPSVNSKQLQQVQKVQEPKKKKFSIRPKNLDPSSISNSNPFDLASSFDKHSRVKSPNPNLARRQKKKDSGVSSDSHNFLSSESIDSIFDPSDLAKASPNFREYLSKVRESRVDPGSHILNTGSALALYSRNLSKIQSSSRQNFECED